MKRLLSAIFVIILLMPTKSFAAPLGKIDLVFDGEAVATQNTITSAIFPVKSGGYFGVWYQASTGIGDPSLSITIEMSYTPTAATMVTPSEFTAIETNLTDTNADVKSVSPPPMGYMRYKVGGLTANTTGTTITMWQFSQE